MSDTVPSTLYILVYLKKDDPIHLKLYKSQFLDEKNKGFILEQVAEFESKLLSPDSQPLF